MEIRFAEAKDVPGILALLKQIGALHHRLSPALFRNSAQKYGASQVLKLLSDSKTPVFVALDEGGAVIGYCLCQVRDYTLDTVRAPGLELYIEDLCVTEALRGQGIGRELFRAAKKYARMRKCSHIALNVWACNREAMAFYEKMGLTVRCVGMETAVEEVSQC